MKQPIQTRHSQRPATRSGSLFGSSRSALLAIALGALAGCSVEPAPTTSDLQASAPSTTEPTASEPVATELAEPTPVATAPPSTVKAPEEGSTAPAEMTATNDPAPVPTTEVATLGAGCFWCIEAVLEQLDGVESVVSGYTGGDTLNPTYGDICTGRTGHAEVVRVTFDPTVLPYKDLLDWFWKSHDPTTLNRQGPDQGTQYRSAIFVHSPAQRKIAETSKLDVQPTFDDPIVTEITDAPVFYEAEKKHQGYYFDNTSQGYCRAVIAPKLKKLGLKY